MAEKDTKRGDRAKNLASSTNRSKKGTAATAAKRKINLIGDGNGRTEVGSPTAENGSTDDRISRSSQSQAGKSNNSGDATICPMCNEVVADNDASEAILCDAGCGLWIHRLCVRMEMTEYTQLSQSDAPWECPLCKEVPSTRLPQEAQSVDLNCYCGKTNTTGVELIKCAWCQHHFHLSCTGMSSMCDCFLCSPCMFQELVRGRQRMANLERTITILQQQISHCQTTGTNGNQTMTVVNNQKTAHETRRPETPTNHETRNNNSMPDNKSFRNKVQYLRGISTTLSKIELLKILEKNVTHMDDIYVEQTVSKFNGRRMFYKLTIKSQEALSSIRSTINERFRRCGWMLSNSPPNPPPAAATPGHSSVETKPSTGAAGMKETQSTTKTAATNPQSTSNIKLPGPASAHQPNAAHHSTQSAHHSTQSAHHSTQSAHHSTQQRIGNHLINHPNQSHFLYHPPPHPPPHLPPHFPHHLTPHPTYHLPNHVPLLNPPQYHPPWQSQMVRAMENQVDQLKLLGRMIHQLQVPPAQLMPSQCHR